MCFPWPLSPDLLSNVAIGQVIAPLLIIQRVANQSALTSNTIVTAQIDSFRTRTRGESARGSRDLPGGYYPTRSMDNHGESTGELEIMAENRVTPQDSGVQGP